MTHLAPGTPCESNWEANTTTEDEDGSGRDERAGRDGDDDELRGAEVDRVLDRNWNELLQELRVTQTGTQILTGFLLTLPFSNGFPHLDERQKNLYLVLMIGSVLTTGLNLAPVAYHRLLFRQRRRRWLVRAANIAARATLAMLALESAAVVLLVFDVVVSLTAGIVAAGVVLVLLLALWAAVPLAKRAEGPGGDPSRDRAVGS